MNQNIRLIALFLVFSTLASLAIGVIPNASAGDYPKTQDLLIKIYFDPTTENWALHTGEIDINDWPVSKDFVDRWTGSSDITMDEYAEIGKMEFDINNQWWPTGPNDPTHSVVSQRNIMFNPSGVRDIAALHFRRAIAHLTNKAKYTTQYMQGMGYIMETEVPVPALEGFTDYSTLTNATAVALRADNPYSNIDPEHRGFLYGYSVDAAEKEFDLGGFRDYDADTYREWRDPGPDGIYGTGDDGTIEELPNMKVFCRIDDPNRRQAGEDLYNEMVGAHIKEAAGTGQPGLEKIVTERSACFQEVMVDYDYNIYTGGWSQTPDVDWIFDFYHSSMGQYGYATNYAGFKCAEFDAYAEKVKYPADIADVKFAAIQAQWVKAKYIPVVELWAAKAVKAYRTGWNGVVNQPGFGIDNYWTFLNMEQAGRTDIKYGFKSDISALQVLTSEWLWDWNVLGLMYDGLLGGNPYDLSEDTGAIAEEWSATSNYPGWTGKTVCEFKVRTGLTFHDGTPVKPADVAFTLLTVRDAGAGNAWNYVSVMDINKIEIAGQIVRVFFNVESAWALHWSSLAVVNKDLWWQAIGDGSAADYNGGFIADDTDGFYTGGTFGNPAAIREYHPWTDDIYTPGISTPGTPHPDGTLDIAQDGSGPWKFVSYTQGQTVRLTKFLNYYSTIIRYGWKTVAITIYPGPPPTIIIWEKRFPAYKIIVIRTFIAEAFHERGNVNFGGGYGETAGWYTSDALVDINDLLKIATSMPSSAGPEPWPGANWGDDPVVPPQYNPDADVDYSLAVNVIDLSTAGLNFNKKQG